MIYFRSDYSQGAHPKVMDALVRTNLEHTDGYGLDEHCANGSKMIQEWIGDRDCQVYMMVGGTPCNLTFIAASLKPYESVVSVRSGHIYSHETGAVEATGHRITAMDGENGKLTPKQIDEAWKEYEDEHTLLPRMAYISQPTEIGTIYSRSEMIALREKCKERGMILYVDGARLGAALTCKDNDLSIEELAHLCDGFYIGGTKNGALFGEALIIRNPEQSDHFRWMMKRQGGLLAKGRLIGVQFEALLEGGRDCVYLQIAAHANEMAELLRNGLSQMGIEFYSNSVTNQVFPILPVFMVGKLEENFFFHRWAPESGGKVPVRLVTGWGTNKEEVEAFLEAVRKWIS